jgi:hypothetical protein
MKLGELWLVSPFFNIVSGLVIALILSVHSVLPFGTGATFVELANTIHASHSAVSTTPSSSQSS